MNITKTIWQHWIKGEKGNQYVQENTLKKLRKIKIDAPVFFLDHREMKLLSTLNKDFMKIGKNMTKIKRGTGLSPAFVIKAVERLEGNGLVTSEVGKGRTKKRHSRERIVKLTMAGYNSMVIWKDIYAFI